MSEVTPGSTAADPALLAALRRVIDPEIGLDVVCLGLVYEAAREGAHARALLTMTSPTCPLGEAILEDARSALLEVPGVETAEVELTFDPPWTPERLTDEARSRLGYQP